MSPRSQPDPPNVEPESCLECALPYVPKGRSKGLCLYCWKVEREYKLTKADEAYRALQLAWLAEREAMDALVEAEVAEVKRKMAFADPELKAENKKLRAVVLKLQQEVARLSVRVPVGVTFPPGMLQSLISLCHPDRHKNSERATEATKWLLAQRGTKSP